MILIPPRTGTLARQAGAGGDQHLVIPVFTVVCCHSSTPENMRRFLVPHCPTAGCDMFGSGLGDRWRWLSAQIRASPATRGYRSVNGHRKLTLAQLSRGDLPGVSRDVMIIMVVIVTGVRSWGSRRPGSSPGRPGHRARRDDGQVGARVRRTCASEGGLAGLRRDGGCTAL